MTIPGIDIYKVEVLSPLFYLEYYRRLLKSIVLIVRKKEYIYYNRESIYNSLLFITLIARSYYFATLKSRSKYVTSRN